MTRKIWIVRLKGGATGRTGRGMPVTLQRGTYTMVEIDGTTYELSGRIFAKPVSARFLTSEVEAYCRSGTLEMEQAWV